MHTLEVIIPFFFFGRNEVEYGYKHVIYAKTIAHLIVQKKHA